MCGIVGYISKEADRFVGEKAHFMRFALALDTLRGADSTGIMTGLQNGNIHTMKSLLPGDAYVQSKQYNKKLRLGWAGVGHNRAATAGEVKIENAHPFKFGPITMVHNGTLVADGRSLPSYCMDLEVDSMQIAHALSVAQANETQRKEVLKYIHGSFALVWFDERDGTLNMARNRERPLHFTFNTDKTMMMFMSEGIHLDSINRSLSRSTARGNSIYQLDPFKLLTFQQGELAPEVASFDPFAVPVQIKPTTTTTTRGGKTCSSGQLTKATNKWKRQLEKNGLSGRVRINGQYRHIPDPMLRALDKEFGLDPDEYLEFKLDRSSSTGETGIRLCEGTVNLVEWGNTPWDAVIYRARKLQVNAYEKQSWLVRPVGISYPTEDTHTAPSILCELIHCDWNQWEEEQNPKVEDQPDDNFDVIAPQGRRMSYKALSKELEKGCVSCGCELRFGSLDGVVWVNDDQDLLCKACNEDLQKLIAKEAVQ